MGSAMKSRRQTAAMARANEDKDFANTLIQAAGALKASMPTKSTTTSTGPGGTTTNTTRTSVDF
jgi:hypothetical protein